MTDSLVRDLAYSVRSLLRERAYTSAAVTSLALGIGATTAIFTVVSGLLLRPLPFPEPDQLVRMYGTSALAPQGDAVAGLGLYREASQSFEALAGYEVSAGYLRDTDRVERVMTVRAEAAFFAMLGVEPVLGRVFDATDPATVAVIGAAFARRLAGSKAADRLSPLPAEEWLGRTIVLDDRAFTIIGVMPESFQFPYRAASLLPGVAAEARTDLWRPLELPPGGAGRLRNIAGRLRAGVTIAAADRELKRIAESLAASDAARFEGRSVYLVPLADVVVSGAVRRAVLLLLAAAGLVLAMTCANLTHLSLVRTTLRSREVAVRSAMGATRLRLIQQFLTESLLISSAGGAIGLVLAWWGTDRVMTIAAARLPRAHEVGFDWRVFGFLFAACVVTGVILALAPAFFAVRTDTRTVLQESAGANTMGRGQRRLRDSLIVAEVALAFLLAVGSALLVRELARLRTTDPGMVTQNVATFHLGRRMNPNDDGQRFYEIADRVAALPGVWAAGFTQLLPLQNWGWTSNSSDFTRAGQAPELPEFPIELRYVTPGYFPALGIAIRNGRGFTEADDRASPPVIIVNETLARLYFEDGDPVGTEMNRGRIVGVVADVHQSHLDRPVSPELYFPVAQNWSQVSELGMTLVVRTVGPPEASIEAIRSVIREADPTQAIFGINLMDRILDDSLADFTLYLVLMACFATLALLLAMTGTYAVISSVATSRMNEFAIRIAVGADSARVLWLVLGHGLSLTALGLMLGLVAIFAAAPLLDGLPVSIRPPDTLTAAPIAAFIVVAATLATLFPARRASRVAPATMLRGP
ncbi:MAG: ABC transporter permease [Longimicrobiales bacterium]